MLSTTYNSALGDRRSVASEAASAYNLFRNIEGTAATGDYYNRTLCDRPHTVSAAALTGPFGMRYNVECNKEYKGQAADLRKLQVESTYISRETPANPTRLENPNNALDNRMPYRSRNYRCSRSDTLRMAMEMLDGKRQ